MASSLKGLTGGKQKPAGPTKSLSGNKPEPEQEAGIGSQDGGAEAGDSQAAESLSEAVETAEAPKPEIYIHAEGNNLKLKLPNGEWIGFVKGRIEFDDPVKHELFKQALEAISSVERSKIKHISREAAEAIAADFHKRRRNIAQKGGTTSQQVSQLRAGYLEPVQREQLIADGADPQLIKEFSEDFASVEKVDLDTVKAAPRPENKENVTVGD